MRGRAGHAIAGEVARDDERHDRQRRRQRRPPREQQRQRDRHRPGDAERHRPVRPRRAGPHPQRLGRAPRRERADEGRGHGYADAGKDLVGGDHPNQPARREWVSAARVLSAPMSDEERPFDVRTEQRDGGVVASRAARSTCGRRLRSRRRSPRTPRAPWCSTCAVSFMDSSGLGLIVEANQRARKHGFRFAVAVGGATDVHRILEMSGLTKVLTFVDDPDAFLAVGTRDPRRVRESGVRDVLLAGRGRAGHARRRLGGARARPAGAVAAQPADRRPASSSRRASRCGWHGARS